MIITNSKAYTECFIQLANVLDLDENRHTNHSLRVAVLAYHIAKILNSPNLQEIFWAGLLHDIGAYGYNDLVISTSEALANIEKIKIINHPIKSAHIIEKLPGEVSIVSKFVKSHHEKYDGTGFPENLYYNEIPICSQIIKVADDFDMALRMVPKLTYNEIINIFKSNINKEYSKEIVELLIETLNTNDLFFKIQNCAVIPILANDILNTLPNYQIFLESDLIEKITTVFADIIDAKHEETLGHSGRVAFYSQHIAQFLNLNPKDITKVKLAGFMHDIGKAAIPRSILNKTSELTPFEWQIMKSHPILTMEILEKMEIFKDIVKIAGYHHERLNGTGYPNGLPAEDIPFLARIVIVADVFDAMTSHRKYQPNISLEYTIEYLKNQKNIFFDGDIVDAMIEIAKTDTKTFLIDY